MKKAIRLGELLLALLADLDNYTQELNRIQRLIDQK